MVLFINKGGWQNGVAVSAIGMDKAAKITYRSFTSIVLSNDDYADARTASITAAEQLYGDCAEEVAQTKNAWGAVGVGSSNNLFCVELDGVYNICSDLNIAYPHYINATTRKVANCTWTVPSGWTYTTLGTYNQTLRIDHIPDPASPTNFTVSVNASWGGSTASDNHTVFVENCGFSRGLDTSNNSNNAINIKNKKTGLAVFPNPVEDFLQFKLLDNEEKASFIQIFIQVDKNCWTINIQVIR